jgi:hypothetical protein
MSTNFHLAHQFAAPVTGGNLRLAFELNLEDMLRQDRKRAVDYEVWRQAGYSLDAPEIIVGGSMIATRYGPQPDDWLPEQTFSVRP